MPTALSVDSFADLVRRSRLVSAEQVQQVLQDLKEEGQEVDSPEALAAGLVDRELLTRWQVGFLMKGKHNGFFLGSYRFLKMLGKGGMGAVYLAEHEMMRRRCAIKVLPTKLISDSSSVLERFYLEAQAVAALDDPNIVRAYDVNKEVQGKREIHYLVMEYVDGADLQVTVEKVGPLDYVQVADYTRQAASGLAHAHDSGLIHRDIKPANLLLDEKGTVKILDLGLARFFDDRLEASLTTTHNESILGTADYLSPEQALDSHNVDTRTDIYSLGCTCYFMLTGQPPFPDGSVAQRLLSHQVKSPTAIEKLRPDVPADLVTIVEKMIAKSPDDRYQKAEEVVDAFQAWLVEHADENWKRTHREFLDGSTSPARREPTRAKSAATEETDLELGLAPTEAAPPAKVSSPTEVSSSAATAVASGVAELGLDQLEELAPVAPAFDVGGSSSGIDDLLNEALDNYPSLDSNVNLADTPQGSGIQPAPQAADSVKSDQIQLSKLILIGLAVSVPLALVILVVAPRLSAPATPQNYGSPAGVQTAQAPQPGLEPDNDTPATTSPATPADGNADPDRRDNPSPTEATDIVEPAGDKPKSGLPEAQEPAKARPVAPPATTQIEPDTTSTMPPPAEQPASAEPALTGGASAPTTSSSPKPIPTADRNPPPTPPANGNPQRDRNSDTQPAPQPPSPAKIEELLGGLSEVTIQLNRPGKGSYDLMVLKTAETALGRAGLEATIGSGNAAPAVLTVAFDYEKKDPVVFNMSAELKCRDDNSNEVTLWKESKEVAMLRRSALGVTPPKVLRDKVSDFYGPLIKEYRLAVAAAKKR